MFALCLSFIYYLHLLPWGFMVWHDAWYRRSLKCVQFVKAPILVVCPSHVSDNVFLECPPIPENHFFHDLGDSCKRGKLLKLEPLPVVHIEAFKHA